VSIYDIGRVDGAKSEEPVIQLVCAESLKDAIPQISNRVNDETAASIDASFSIKALFSG